MFRLMLLTLLLAASAAHPRTLDRGPVRTPHRPLDLANPQDENYVLRNGSLAFNFTNFGFFGNDGPAQSSAYDDPCSGEWAPQFEYPEGSGAQYLFQGALWIGALIDYGDSLVPRVSVGTDGWQNPSINEFHAGEAPNNGIVLRSNLPEVADCFGNSIYDPNARANIEAIAVYSDTLNDQLFPMPEPVDGLHRPLGLQVTQTVRMWVNPEYSGIAIHEFRIRNIGEYNLKNVFLGIYTDSDIGRAGGFQEHTDDLSGSILVDTAQGRILGWSADNDGYPANRFGPPLELPHAFGAVALSNQFENPDREFATSFNWWISNSNMSWDFGPSWDDGPQDWTRNYGTPGGDLQRLDLLSNRERDYNQIYIDLPRDYQLDTSYACASDGEQHNWRPPDFPPFEFPSGHDTRFMLGYGPLGELDYFDNEGKCVTRLNPGEELVFTVALFIGQDFHDSEHPQPYPSYIDTTLFDFTGLLDSYHKAQRIFDSNYEFQPMPPVGNLRVTRALDQAVPLRWEAPEFGNPNGYLVAGRADSGEGELVYFTPTPIPDRAFVVTGLENGSWWQFSVLALDAEGIPVARDTLVHVGAVPNFSTLHGQAFAHGDSLWWDISNDPLKTGYKLVRTSNADTVIYSGIQARTFLDTAVVSGRAYTYRMYIESATGVQSEPANAITLTPFHPTASILIFDETKSRRGVDFSRGAVSDTSVREFYETLFNLLGETYDYFDGDTTPPNTEQLARYEIVFSHRDNVFERTAAHNDARDQALSDYLAIGGRLIQSGRTTFYSSGMTGNFRYVSNNVTIGTLTFDSVFVSRRFSANYYSSTQTTGATALDTTFPSFMWDSVKVQTLRYISSTVEFLPEIDLMWPNGDTRPIYTAIMHESDSTGYFNPPCAVIGPRSMLFGFPLYFVQMSTALDIMASSLEALRTQVVETPDPPAPLPASIVLHQNYPNPFNATTTIEFELPTQMNVNLKLYNVQGQLVRTVASGSIEAGSHRVMVNGESLASGLYFYRLEAGATSQTRKMLLLK